MYNPQQQRSRSFNQDTQPAYSPEVMPLPIYNKLIARLEYSFLRNHLDKPNGLNIILPDYEISSPEQVECLLNRLALYIVLNGNLSITQRNALRLEYQECCAQFQTFLEEKAQEEQLALAQFSSTNSDPASYSQSASYSSSAAPSTESDSQSNGSDYPYSDDEDGLLGQFALCDEPQQKPSPTHSPSKHGYNPFSQGRMAQPIVNLFDSNLFSFAPTAPPASEVGSRPSTPPMGWSNSGSRQLSYDGGGAAGAAGASGPPPFSLQQLYPKLTQGYNAEIRQFFYLLICLRCDVEIKPEYIQHVQIDQSNPRPVGKNSFPEVVAAFANSLKCNVTLAKSILIEMVDFICATRSHLLENFFLQDHTHVHPALSALGTQLQYICQHYQIYEADINQVIQGYNQRVAQSHSLLPGLFQQAAVELLKSYSNHVVKILRPSFVPAEQKRLTQTLVILRSLCYPHTLPELSREQQLRQIVSQTRFDYQPEQIINNSECRFNVMHDYIVRLRNSSKECQVYVKQADIVLSALSPEIVRERECKFKQHYGFIAQPRPGVPFNSSARRQLYVGGSNDFF